MGIKVRNRTLCRATITCRNALSGLSFVLPAMERDALLKRLANTLNAPQLMIKFLTAVDDNEVLFVVSIPDTLDVQEGDRLARCTICGDRSFQEPLLDREDLDAATCERCCPEFLCKQCLVFLRGERACLACLELDKVLTLQDTRRLVALQAFWELDDIRHGLPAGCGYGPR